MPASRIEIMGPFTDAERDALVANGNMPVNTIIFNSDADRFEFWTGSDWRGVLGNDPIFTGTVSAAALDIAGSVITLSAGAATFTALIYMFGARLNQSQGADVASANNLVVGLDGNVFEITGATQINLLSVSDWQLGAVVTLLFASTPTVKHGQATSSNDTTILLAGGVDFVASAGDTLTLCICEIGGVLAWREISRVVI